MEKDTLIFELFNKVIQILNLSLFHVGDASVTALGVLRVIFILVIAWWVSKITRLGLSRLSSRWKGMNPSSVYTIGRIFHYSVLALGFTIGLSTIGIDFTNFALMAGALGVGIGFGLQNIVGNFISGLIILFEKSLKIGDFVELESGVVGEVREISIRFTRITTNDNIDILVPNSEFVNGRMVNWTLDEAYRRTHIPFGVAYGTDKEKVKEAALEAANKVPFTLTGVPRREPQVWFVKFGDSSLDFELVVWLKPEAVKRPSAVQATYLWELHTALYKHGIEIPFPQQDVHLRSLFGLQDDQARQWLNSTRKTQAPN